MERVAGARAPMHVWIIGILSLLWNGFGCYDYFMTRTKGAAWIEQMMHTADGQAMMDYINAFPIWASIGWGLGVWMGLAGSILLLMRRRLAVEAFALSALGAIIGIGYRLMNPSGIAEMNEGINRTMPFVIILVAVGLFFYARTLRAKGLIN